VLETKLGTIDLTNMTSAEAAWLYLEGPGEWRLHAQTRLHALSEVDVLAKVFWRHSISDEHAAQR